MLNFIYLFIYGSGKTHYCTESVQMKPGLNFISLINCFFITTYLIILYYTALITFGL